LLLARTVPIADIGADLCARMYRLFSRYYANVSAAQFDADLASKQFVILLEAAGELIGFTSASVTDHRIDGEQLSVVFSGDTIVDQRHWGQQALAKAWLKEMGRLARLTQPKRLVWFLIVKGHRTYRYLPAFALRYVPPDGDGSGNELIRLRDVLATEKFGRHYDPVSGIIRFDQSRGQLKAECAEPSEREMRLPEVEFFLHANPGFRQGDELACLTEITRENMPPLAQRWFDEGYDGG
jgi:hypothetical protein